MVKSLITIMVLFFFIGIASIIGGVVVSSYILEIPVTEVIDFIINDTHPIFLTN